MFAQHHNLQLAWVGSRTECQKTVTREELYASLELLLQQSQPLFVISGDTGIDDHADRIACAVLTDRVDGRGMFESHDGRSPFMLGVPHKRSSAANGASSDTPVSKLIESGGRRTGRGTLRVPDYRETSG